MGTRHFGGSGLAWVGAVGTAVEAGPSAQSRRTWKSTWNSLPKRKCSPKGISWTNFFGEIPSKEIGWTNLLEEIPPKGIGWTNLLGEIPSKEVGWRNLLGEIPSKEIGWRNLLGEIPSKEIGWKIAV